MYTQGNSFDDGTGLTVTEILDPDGDLVALVAQHWAEGLLFHLNR